MQHSPITNQNKFFSEREYQYYLSQAREHLASAGSHFYFIKVDKEQSQIDDLYGESYQEEITYEVPIKVPAIIKLNSSDNDTYVKNKGLGRYEQFGNIELNVLLSDLDRLNIDITYGDFIGYKVTEDKTFYFEVSNDGQTQFDNEKIYMGYKPFWRKIIASATEQTFEI